MDDYDMLNNFDSRNVNQAFPRSKRPDSRGNADRVVNTVCKDCGATRRGRDWLKAVLDPFHDSQLAVEGMPDGSNALSTRQIVTQAAVITSTTGPWDVSIVDFPTINSGPKPTFQQVTAYNIGNNGPTGGFQFGPTVFQAPTGLSWIQGATGSNLDWTSTTPSAGGTIQLPNTYGQSPYRVIAKGFEVYNTSNVLNQGGNVVMWTQNMPDIRTASAQLVTQNSYGNPGTFSLCLAPAPPNSVSNAEILPNSVNHLAAQGAYVVGRLSSADVPTSTATCAQFLYYGNTPTANPYLLASPLTAGSNSYPTIFSQQYFNQTGAYFSGLPANSTLFVRYRLVIELFPSYGDSLLTSSRPSPGLDTIALEIYSRAMAKLPVGVPVDENGLGDWFRTVVDTIKSAPIIGSLVKVPGKIVSGVDAVINKAAGMVAEGDFNGAATEMSQLAPQGKMAKLLSGKALTSGVKNKGRSKGRSKAR